MTKVLNSQKIKSLREFLLTGRFFMILFAVAAIFTTFEWNVAGVLVFAAITGLILVLCEDLVTTLMPFLFICLMATKCYNSYSVFIQYKVLGVLLICCVVSHFILYWKKPVIKGALTWPMLAVSVATALGGIGVISAKEYFAGASVFYILALGGGMLVLYILLNTHITVRKDYSMISKLALIMEIVGCFACYMILAHYITHINELIDTKTILYFQWRNNISTFLMLAIPFAFFRGNKQAYNIILAFFFFFCIMLTGSRGGLVFGAIEMLMCCILFVLYDKQRRLAYLTLFVCIGFAIMIFSREFVSFFGSTFDRLMSAINSTLYGETKEIRVFQYERGIRDFLNHPILGTGLGYNGNRDIYDSADFSICWYHCEPIQIAASMGIVGIAAYLYQFVKRQILLWKKPTLFNMTVFLSYISLELMSLVNPGIFSPIPYLLIVTIFFVIVDKCSTGEYQKKIHHSTETDSEEEEAEEKAFAQMLVEKEQEAAKI